MMKLIFVCVFSAFIVACGGDSSEDPIDKSPQLLPVYNQAYQENFAEDTMPEIATHAKNAYVLLDTFNDGAREYIASIKQEGNQIGGYISAGTGENWREDFSSLQPYLTPTAWPDWPNEFFISETTTGILPLMKARIDKLANADVDWVEFDNMDWLDEETRETYNLSTTVEEAKTYINKLCDYTHSKGMKCMAKNSVEGFSNFDGVLYESYRNEKNWWNTTGFKQFLAAGKPVIINHYNEIDCDGVYSEYKTRYKSTKISFICEDVATERYKHYNQ